MIETYIVDSFTTEIFKGNPAGVCIVDQSLEDPQMLSIAKELGLSETAFIEHIENNRYSIRYFSTKMEIPLCGHATLASAKVLFQKTEFKEIQFNTIEQIQLDCILDGSEIEMNFPIYQTVPATAPTSLLSALGIDEVAQTSFNTETNILILEIVSDTDLKNLSPDFEALVKSHDSINGVLVTAPSSDPAFDFQSRYFWPWSGTNEDPVTGGTHTFLSKYWSDKLDKTSLRSFQCSERSGQMHLELTSPTNVKIKSQAVIVLQGNLLI